MSRNADHPIEPLFKDRWSMRSFTDEPISDAQLFSLFEAARWAPSASNTQPWRFLYAKRGDEHWETFKALVLEGNRLWSDKAAALIFILSCNEMVRHGEKVALLSHSFDTGAAWVQFALQAHLHGWGTHAMGGINRDKVRTELAIPDTYTIECGVAVGRPGPLESLPEKFHPMEKPNARNPITDWIAAGAFKW